MKLTAKVIATHSASDSADRKPHVTLKVEEAQWTDSKLKLANADGLALDDELCLLVLQGNQADHLFTALDYLEDEGSLPSSLKSLHDQLRPDEPPPFLSDNAETALKFAREFIADVEAVAAPQPDTADTLEFRLGGTV